MAALILALVWFGGWGLMELGAWLWDKYVGSR